MKTCKLLLPLLLLLLSSCGSINLSAYTGAGARVEQNTTFDPVVDYGFSIGGPLTIQGQSFYGYGGYNPVFRTTGIGISKGVTLWRNKSERHNRVNKQSHNQRTNNLIKFNQINDSIQLNERQKE